MVLGFFSPVESPCLHYFVLFCFIFFCYIFFCFILLYFPLLYFPLFYLFVLKDRYWDCGNSFALFCFALFCFIFFCFILFIYFEGQILGLWEFFLHWKLSALWGGRAAAWAKDTKGDPLAPQHPKFELALSASSLL